MPESREDDLFRESTMTFGQHLEELRACLFKSLLGLLVGFIVGLTIGGYVVQFIQRPLSRALTDYYQRESVERLQGELTAKQIEDRVQNENMLADEVYIDPVEMLRDSRMPIPNSSKYPPSSANATGRAAHEQKLAPVFITTARMTHAGAKVLISPKPLQSISRHHCCGGVASQPVYFLPDLALVAAGLYPHERHYVHISAV